MNTLQQLNQYDETIVYTDLRTIGPIFDKDPTNQILNFNEGQTPIWPTGIDIIDIIDYVSTNLIVTFDVSSQPGATLGWSNVPSHLTIQNSNGVYTISGIRTVEDWISIRNPIIYAAISVFGNYSFTCTLRYLTTKTKQYTVSGNIVNIQEFTAPQTFWYSTSPIQLVVGAPNVNVNPDPTPVWSVSVYSDNIQAVDGMATAGSGGTSIFNTDTKVLTIDGSNTEINSHLNTLWVTFSSSEEIEFKLVYNATHLVEGYSDTVKQDIKPESSRYLLGSCLTTISYVEDDIVAYDNTPYITDEEYTGTENYTYTISVSDLNAVYNISCVGYASFGTFDNTSKTYTITRPKSEINANIKKIKIDSANDYVETFDIYYSIVNPLEIYAQKVTTASVVENLPEVVNIELDRKYLKNIPSNLFVTSIPQIVDNDITNVNNYTIEFTSTNAKFKLSTEGTAVNTWTKTGAKTTLNAYFKSLQVVPPSGLTTDMTATYTQKKNGVTQVTQTFNICGPGINYSYRGTQSITVFEGQSHTVPEGITLTEVIKPFVYVISTNTDTATVIWDTVPSGCVVENPSPGKYSISNIDSVAKWDIVKSPRVIYRNDVFGTKYYSADLFNYTYQPNSITGWGVAANITDVPALTSTTASTYVPGSNTKLTGTTSIDDAGPLTPTWTVTVTPNDITAVSVMSSSGSGGVSTFNPTSKVLTIVGTQDQINSHLSNLYYTGTTTNDLSVILNYYANNSQTSEVGAVNQKISSTRTTILQATRSDATFTSQTQMDLTNGPLFNASLSDVTGYTMAISAYPSTAVSNIRVNLPTGFSLRSDQINVSPMYPSMQKISQDGSVLAVFDNSTFTVSIYRFNGTTWDLSYSYSEGSGNYIYDDLIGMSDDGSLVFTSKYNSATDQYTIRTHYFNGTTYVLQSTTLYVTERATTTLGDSSDGYYTVGAFSSNGLKMYSWETYTYGGADYSRLYYRTWSTTAKVWSSRTYILQTTANTVVKRIISNKTGSVAAIALYDLTDHLTGTQLATLVNSTLTIIRTGIVTGFNLYFAINDDGSLISIYRYIYRNNGTSWVLDYTLSSTQYPIQFFDNNQLAVLDSNTVKFFIKTSSFWDLTYTDSVLSNRYILLNMYSKNMKVKVIPNSRIMTFYTTSYIDWNGSTKVLTLTGKKSLLNSYIDKLSITPAQDTSFEIRYTGTTSASATTTRNQFITKV